jgi:hypothetical protein
MTENTALYLTLCFFLSGRLQNEDGHLRKKSIAIFASDGRIGIHQKTIHQRGGNHYGLPGLYHIAS